MTEIVFLHDGWTVATSAWTVASKKPNEVEICYLWQGLSDNTGVASIKLDMSMSEFLARTKSDNRVDLRTHQRGPVPAG